MVSMIVADVAGSVNSVLVGLTLEDATINITRIT